MRQLPARQRSSRHEQFANHPTPESASAHSSDGSITLTGGSIAGRALASVALTLTGTTVTGCAALTGGC
jgi:hypothetical protein